MSCKDKDGYPSRAAAKRALHSTKNAVSKHAPKYMKNQVNKRRREKRAYKCDQCTLWHLTSMSLEDWKRLEQARNT